MEKYEPNIETFNPAIDCPECGLNTDLLVETEQGAMLCRDCFERDKDDPYLLIPDFF
jgi:NMD protein affecting ribosome stability and mRNA decay